MHSIPNHHHSRRRTGVLTTDKVKLGAMTLLNVMMRERRVHLLPAATLVSADAKGQHRRLRDQLGVYSMQFKVPDSVFQRGRYALSGKVGGMKVLAVMRVEKNRQNVPCNSAILTFTPHRTML
eukprot:2066154-Rhodomonas_salina.1